jgi:hypothetical protein
MKKYIEKIEKIISRNSEQRGMSGIKLEKDLENSAMDLNESETVLIVTGFCIKLCRIGETDGPLGAISLAHALYMLKKKVVIVTDKYSGDLLKSGIDKLSLEIDIIAIEDENSEAVNYEIMEKYKPQHVIAIERPGRAKDGKSYSMKGEDITEYSPDTDIIFELAKRNGIKTSAIGDGGNEIGMGKIGDYVRDNVHLGEKICAETSADNLIVAGVSNWGGHALSSVLSVMNDRMLMYDALTETEILKRIVLAGAVDGCTGEKEMTVDGLSFSENIKTFRELREIAENELIKRKLI